jgi:CheY-like chemotaxis protein
MAGWRVLRCLKEDLATRHIPVQVISVDACDDEAVREGARGAIGKPTDAEALHAALRDMRRFVDRPTKELLLVSRDDAVRRLLLETIGNGDVQTTAMDDPSAALDHLTQTGCDCVLVALESEADSEQLSAIAKECAARGVPLIAYESEATQPKAKAWLGTAPQASPMRVVSSVERMFDETARALHRCVAHLPESQRRLLEQLAKTSEPLRGARILIVDDDIRNIFAMTSLLEAHGMEVCSAETGSDALRLLRERSHFDVILMDIMLPGMDGYETMRAMRKIANLRGLPIVALTAKAMRGDRDRCIEAGASDYLSKPVESARLLSTLRLWLTPEHGSDRG